MKRNIALLGLALLSLFSALEAQSLSGRVLDDLTGEPVISAIVQPTSSRQTCVTDSLGRFSFKGAQTIHQLKVTRIGYLPALHTVNHASSKQIEIRMISREALPVVEITAGAERVFEDPALHLYDYEFADDGLWAIVYDKSRARSVLAWVDRNDSIVKVTDGPEAPGQLFKDCMGQVHVLTKNLACQLFLDDNGDIGMFVDGLKEFEAFVMPCLGYAEGNYFFRQDRLNGQSVEYFRYDASSTEPKLVLHLKDKEKIYQMLDPLGAYAPFASTEKELLAIPPQIWEKINNLDAELQFQRLVFFYPIHAPLRVIDGEVWIFDHTHGLLRHFEAGGGRIDSTEITYHNLPKWDRQILIDEQRAEAYTTFERHGFVTLHEIDIKTGELGESWELPKQFPKKIQIRNGTAYFLYREQEQYDDTKRLYRMALKY